MINLDALKAELEAAGFTVSAVAAGVLFASKPIRDDGRRVEWCVSSEGAIKADARIPGKHGWELVPFDERTFAEYAIIARHVAPVVTPEPDAEVRDVFVEAVESETSFDRLYCETITDAGLAALRAKGFAVVRTADVEPRTCAGCKLATPRVAGETMMCGLWGAEVAVSFSCAAWEAIR